MRNFNLGLLLLLGGAALNPSLSAAEECKDIVLQLTDENPDPKIKSPKTYMIIDCHEASGTYHAASTINFIHYYGGQICHGYRVCGNVKGITGEIRIGAAWDFVNASLAAVQAAATKASTNTNASLELALGDSTASKANPSPLFGAMDNAPGWLQDTVGYIPGQQNNYPQYGECSSIYGDAKPIYSNDGVCGLPPHTCVSQAEYDAACNGGGGGGTGGTGTGTGSTTGTGYNSGMGYNSYPVRNGVFAEFKTNFQNLIRYCTPMREYSCISPGKFHP